MANYSGRELMFERENEAAAGADVRTAKETVGIVCGLVSRITFAENIGE